MISNVKSVPGRTKHRSLHATIFNRAAYFGPTLLVIEVHDVSINWSLFCINRHPHYGQGIGFLRHLKGDNWSSVWVQQRALQHEPVGHEGRLGGVVRVHLNNDVIATTSCQTTDVQAVVGAGKHVTVRDSIEENL